MLSASVHSSCVPHVRLSTGARLNDGAVVQVLKGSEYFGKYGKIKKVTVLAYVSQHEGVHRTCSAQL